ncbi:reverse transcriptase domain-containing protein [Tanacetum coccineum]
MAERTMEELLRAPTKGYGEAIVLPEMTADQFEIKTNLLQLVQANPFHGFENENPNAHINSFKRITSTLRFRNVPNDVIKLMMFPYSLEGAAKTWYEKEPPNSILTWEDLSFSEVWERFKEMLRACPHHGFTELTQVDTFYNGLNDNDQDSLNAAAGGNLLSKTTREALNIIENKSKVRYSRNKPNASRMNTTSRESDSKTDERIDKLADQLSTLVEIVSKKVVTPAPVKAVKETCVTCGGTHSWYNCPATDNNQASVCATTGGLFQNHASTSGTLPSNTIPNPKGKMKAITTRSGVAYEGPSIPTNPSPKKVVEQETEETTNKEQTKFQGSTTHIPHPVIPISISEHNVPKPLPKTTPIPEPDILKNSPKLNIPYPSRLNQEKSRDKASNQMEKIFQIIQDLRFDISFADALLLMPRFAPTIKSLLMNKENLLELAKIPLNENCSAMLLKKLPKKLGDPGKFLIPYVFVKVGSFHFPTDFVVVDFEADPQVPLILGRSFLRTSRALIDVYEGELILRDGDERLIFHANKHPQKHTNESIKMINFIDVSCEDSVGEVLRLKKSNHFLSGSTTPLSKSCPSLTSFETSDSLLEEFADELALLDPFPLGNEDVDVEAKLREIELLINRDPSTIFSPTITIDPNPERFTDEPSPACLPPPGDDDDDESFLKEDDVESNDSNVSNFDEPVLLNTPLFDKDECFDPGGDNDEIDAFLAIEVSTNIEEGYYDSEGDVFYLESLLSDDTIHNLSFEVFFDHEPQHFKNESDHDTLITFSPKNDPLHHEFAGELITLPPRIVREHEEYISRMWLLCGNSSSRSPENFHASPNTIIESLPTFPIPVEDSDSLREEIDIFPSPDDSIPPGIESDFDSEEEINFLDNLLNDDIFVPEYERFTVDIEPDAPLINNFDELNEDECFDPGGGEINVEVDDSFTFFI